MLIILLHFFGKTMLLRKLLLVLGTQYKTCFGKSRINLDIYYLGLLILCDNKKFGGGTFNKRSDYSFKIRIMPLAYSLTISNGLSLSIINVATLRIQCGTLTSSAYSL